MSGSGAPARGIDRTSLAQAPEPGSLLAGKYRVEHTIAIGGMGVIVEATHLALGQRLAVKLLGGGDESYDDEAVEQLLDEARTVAQLPADHIARAVDAGRTEEGRPYFAMERLVGRDLEEELEARMRLPVREAVSYVLQACEGVAEAHAVDLVHRDIKPANLFLTRRRDGAPLVKVVDFGVASWIRPPSGDLPESHGDRPLCGTPAYMAPEQFTGEPVDGRADQYALAVVLFELITGQPPFAAPSIRELRGLVQSSPPPPLRSLRADAPASLARAIARALSKDPAERFADLAGFAAAIAPHGGAEGRASARAVAFTLGRLSREQMLGRSVAARVSSGLRTVLATPRVTATAAAVFVGLVGFIGIRLDGAPAAPGGALPIAGQSPPGATVSVGDDIGPGAPAAPVPAPRADVRTSPRPQDEGRPSPVEPERPAAPKVLQSEHDRPGAPAPREPNGASASALAPGAPEQPGASALSPGAPEQPGAARPQQAEQAAPLPRSAEATAAPAPLPHAARGADDQNRSVRTGVTAREVFGARR